MATTKPNIKLFNTLTRSLEVFRPQNPDEVKIYTCGPTVYSTPHVGNFAAYVYWDLLVRLLQLSGYKVKRVLNLTDVGHLVSDGDEGEDKLEKGARTSGKSVWEVAEFYTKQFLHDFHSLELVEPTVIARATDYIKEDQALVDKLTKKGFTYETSDGIYFDVSKFPRYADFARLDLDGLEAGKRVDFNQEKRGVADFAVWKFIQPGEQHAMRWDYLGRPGYPGWHLECSTIIHTELGEPIDIHTGGIDHIPVHHTNEIAQSEAAFDKTLSRFWLHCHHLTVDGAKISKSLGNGWSLADLAEQGYAPLDYKMWVLQGNYQSERDFNLEGLTAARTRRLRWRNQVAKCRQGFAEDADFDADDAFKAVLAATSENLGSAAAFALIDQLEIGNLEFWQQVDELFGLGLLQDPEKPSAKVQKLLDTRVAARAKKDFTRSDELRDELSSLGYGVLDTPDGQIWQYLR